MTIFLRALDELDKSFALEAAISSDPSGGSRFNVNIQRFSAIPGSPFAYWVSDALLSTFANLEAFEAGDRTVKQGLATADDFRFLRCSWEVHRGSRGRDWRPLSKGGTTRGYYTDFWLCIDWRSGGHELAAFTDFRTGKQRSAIRNPQFYGSPGFTYTLRAARFCPQILPAGAIISTRGSGIYVEAPGGAAAKEESRLAFLALMNSSIFDRLVKLMLGREGHPQFDMGDIALTPIPPLQEAEVCLGDLARRSWSLRRGADARAESSHAFVLPALLQVEGVSLASRAEAWAVRVRAVEAELEAIQAEIDERCFDLYGIDEADRRAISEGFGSDVGDSDPEERAVEVDEVDDEGDVEADVDAAGLAAGLVSWCVGVAFGRFDVRLAIGERELPGEPGPFDPLPVCSPGMLVGEDGLPARSAPSGYPVDVPGSGVLVDDPGDARDLTAAVRAVFDRVFGASADALWDEAATLLDPRGHDLRAWLRSGSFERHLKLHSKSRRKAPILWQLGTPSVRYSVWLHAHRLTDDSLFRLQNDVLAQKLAYEERQLTNLVQSSGGSPSAKERREIEAQERFVEELRVLLEEVKRVAPLWKPTLDDGIVLVMAPLWRLVPHKGWQRELKKKWAELVEGKYDWAQLAMHLWPERVVPKCATDRSLAIAHGLEDVFWAEDEDGKWQPRQEPTTDVDELIQQRTSTAAKNAIGAVP